MEEDIEIIEEFIESDGIYEIYHASHADKVTKAIENIIARLKELEKENKELKQKINNAMAVINDDTHKYTDSDFESGQFQEDILVELL